jgi:bromodomain-containing factor 1
MSKPMTPAQYRHATHMLRSIKRLKDAHVFLHPVDPVKLNIPDYPLIIKNPMDLTTVEKKLSAREYFSVDSLVSDFLLMFENCIKYNGPQSVFATMANNVKKSMERYLSKMPSESELMSVSPVHSMSDVASLHGSVTRASTSARLAGKTPRGGSSHKSSPSVSRKVSNASEIKLEPLSPSVPSSKKSLPGTRRLSEELKFCYTLIKEFFKKQHSDFAYPFLAPVDRKLYPQYYEVIKNPMDMGTIKKRLEDCFYSSASQFEHDVMLVFKNCFKFNPVGTPVRIMGQKLEAFFKQKWGERPSHTSSHAPSVPNTPAYHAYGASSSTSTPARTPNVSNTKGAGRSRGKPKASPPVVDDLLDDSDSSDDDLKRTIAVMEKNLQQIQEQLEALRSQQRERKRKKKEARAMLAQQQLMLEQQLPTSSGRPGMAHGSNRRQNNGSRGAPSRTSRGGRSSNYNGRSSSSVTSPVIPSRISPLEPTLEITYEMKRELSEKINDLSSDKLQQVLAIIQESMPQLSEGATDEIELDITSLDNQTLYRLWQLVTEESTRHAHPSHTSHPGNISSSDAGSRRGSSHISHLPPYGHAMGSATSTSAAPINSLGGGLGSSNLLHKGPTALSSVVRNSSDEEGSDSESSSSGSESD